MSEPPVTPSIESVAVLGFGTMGQGIAVAVAAAGLPVRVHDRPDRLADCLAQARTRWHRCRAGDRTGTLPAEPDLTAGADLAEAVDGADLVVEAVAEDPRSKQAALRALHGLVGAGTVVATNTSSLPLDGLAEDAPDPTRFLATHFFNPAEVVPGVEVAPGPATDPTVVRSVSGFLEALGKDPVRVAGTAGFVANRIQVAMFAEALACVEDGSATTEDVDRVVRRTFGFRLPAYGPFAVADMAGLDVYAAMFETFAATHGARFRVPERLAALVERGRLGVKSGGGFADYGPAETEALLAGRDDRYRRLLDAAE